MSSILKALRKLEDEKATLGEGSVDLAHDILKRSYDQRKSTPLLVIAMIAGALLVLGGATWWFYVPPIESPSPPVSVKQSPPPKTLAEQPLLKVDPPEQIIAEPPQQTTKAITPVVENKVIQRSSVVVKEQPVPVAAPATVAEAEPIDIPVLKVEEIVYHQQPESRLAIINDLPVMEGTDILGAHVEEILPDRVLFSFKGLRFNKFLSSSD